MKLIFAIVQDEDTDALTEALVEAMKAVKIGLPFDEGVQMGPLISAVQRERVEERCLMLAPSIDEHEGMIRAQSAQRERLHDGRSMREGPSDEANHSGRGRRDVTAHHGLR